MKKINLKKKVNFREMITQARENRKKNKKRLKHGSYSMAVTGLVIASVVVFNMAIQEFLDFSSWDALRLQ